MKKNQTDDLFEYKLKQDMARNAPLAARMRPRNLSEFVGQEEILREGSILRSSIKNDTIDSLILWGPPGSGKTTLARIMARETRSQFFSLSAVSSGVAQLREVVGKARELRSLYGKKSILFIDEIHRFNKAQQDAVLPFVENGLITLIGATTENPSFEVNSALLSRSRVYRLQRLSEEHIRTILQRALADNEKGFGNLTVEIDDAAWNFLQIQAQGDARVALNALEVAVTSSIPDENGIRKISLASLEDALQHRATLYDKNGEQHYDLISALHKSMRNSDPQAALYWLGRMIEGGEDPLYIARRVVRFASEDIGLADPQALVQAITAYHAIHFIGLPEGNLALAQAVVYMSGAPKSNSLYVAMSRVKEDIDRSPQLPVPLHLRNPVTSMMKEFGFGSGYKYAHDFPDHRAEMECLPENLRGREYFVPSPFGWEAEVMSPVKREKKRVRKASEQRR